MVPNTVKGRPRREVIVNDKRKSWSIQLGTIGEIPIRLHLTFLAVLAWLLFGSDSKSALSETLFVIAIFICVLLHELGHALVAKRFGIATRDITLYPFGGVASILSQPTPKSELIVAIAGPIVNLIIALAVYPWISIPDLTLPGEIEIPLPVRFFFTNLALAIFNLLPALPMDGGRILRACLSLSSVKEPTKIAARISQILCIGLAICGYYFEQPMLFVISVVIFLGAMQEHIRYEAKTIAASFTLRDAMIPKERLESFPHGTTISQALRIALTSWQSLYPVMNGDDLLGIAMRDDVMEYGVTEPNNYIGKIIKRAIPEIDIETPLADAYTQMDASGTPVLSVTRDGRYAGLLVFDRLADFLLMHDLRDRMPKEEEDIEWMNP